MAVIKDTFNRFKSSFVAASETIEERLQAAKSEAVALEAELRAGALDAAIGDDPNALASTQARLRNARDRIELLEAAGAEAARLERERLAKAAGDAERARRRAMGQHLASLRSAAAEYERGVALCNTAWQEMLRSAGKMKLVSKPAVEPALTTLVSPRHLGRLCTLEMTKAGGEPASSAIPPLPGSDWDHLGDLVKWNQNPRQMPSLSEKLHELLHPYTDQKGTAE